MKTTCPRRFIALALMGALAASAGAVRGETAPGTIDRTVLPIHEPPAPTFTELDARTAKPPPRFDLKAPAGAPNVLVILIDDMGFGQPSTFGGPHADARSARPGRLALQLPVPARGRGPRPMSTPWRCPEPDPYRPR